MELIYSIIDKRLRDKSFFNKILRVDHSKSYFVTFLNPFSYNVFLNKPELIGEFNAFFADGALLVTVHNLFNKDKIDRLSFDFSSIATDVLEYSENNNLSISFIGATEEELQGTLVNIKKLYSKLNIVYTRNGYFNNKEDYKECFNSLKDTEIDILIIGMGSPYQEEFAIKVKNKCINIPLVLTCGGFLTQTSIKADYYYPWIKKLGLRWLQRAIMHRHVRDRLIKDYPIFIVKYIWYHIKKDLRNETVK